MSAGPSALGMCLCFGQAGGMPGSQRGPAWKGPSGVNLMFRSCLLAEITRCQAHPHQLPLFHPGTQFNGLPAKMLHMSKLQVPQRAFCDVMAHSRTLHQSLSFHGITFFPGHLTLKTWVCCPAPSESVPYLGIHTALSCC